MNEGTRFALVGMLLATLTWVILAQWERQAAPTFPQTNVPHAHQVRLK